MNIRATMIAALVFSGALIGVAQEKPAAPTFETERAKLLQGDHSVDFALVRRLWTTQAAYNPYLHVSDDYGEKLHLIQKQIAAKDFEHAKETCIAGLGLYLLDIKWNLRCADAYSGLGDESGADLHNFLVTGLIRSIRNSGDGTTPAKAFDVITLMEESAALASLGLHQKKQELIIEHGDHYDKITGVDKDGREQVVYFRINAIWAWLERQGK